MLVVDVIASCTDRKRLPVPAARRLRSIRYRNLDQRFAAWWRTLSDDASGAVEAQELYSGDHWAIARKLPQAATANGWHVRLWVASAGYGLIPASAPVLGYSATFAPNHPDSVARGEAGTRDDARRWWKHLGAVSGPVTAPRRLVDLARTPSHAILVVASDLYVDAMEDDLCAARDVLGPSRLMVISGRPQRATRLSPNWVETDARLRQVLGGALGSLHVRVARHLLTGLDPAGLSVSTARTCLDHLLTKAPPLPAYNRRRSEDKEVEAFIQQALRRDPNARHTPLLRMFRASGRQCEQQRFRSIFHQVSEGA